MPTNRLGMDAVEYDGAIYVIGRKFPQPSSSMIGGCQRNFSPLILNPSCKHRNRTRSRFFN